MGKNLPVVVRGVDKNHWVVHAHVFRLDDGQARTEFVMTVLFALVRFSGNSIIHVEA